MRGFDEAMSTKANKAAFTLLEEKFMREYIHHGRWAEVHEKVHDIGAKLHWDCDELRKEINEFKENYTSEIHKTC